MDNYIVVNMNMFALKSPVFITDSTGATEVVGAYALTELPKVIVELAHDKNIFNVKLNAGANKFAQLVEYEIGSITKTFTAHWTANEYTVIYNANGGTANKENDTALYGSGFTLATAERIGYSFVGWYNGKTK